MKKRTKILWWSLPVCLIALMVWAANPSFNDFDVSQFIASSAGPNQVSIKALATLTNVFGNSGGSGFAILGKDTAGTGNLLNLTDSNNAVVVQATLGGVVVNSGPPGIVSSGPVTAAGMTNTALLSATFVGTDSAGKLIPASGAPATIWTQYFPSNNVNGSETILFTNTLTANQLPNPGSRLVIHACLTNSANADIKTVNIYLAGVKIFTDSRSGNQAPGIDVLDVTLMRGPTSTTDLTDIVLTWQTVIIIAGPIATANLTGTVGFGITGTGVSSAEICVQNLAATLYP